ncbi:MAG: restriction endonuclease subunit S [Verrucomicrobiales bacterium]|nr:restriction endonuclease subunit S [Verrucomicrobiae bacterium]
MTTPHRPLHRVAEVHSGLPVSAPGPQASGGGALVMALMPASLKSDAEFSPGPDRLVKVLAASPPDSRYQVRSGDILVTAKSTETSLRCGLIAADWEQRPSPVFASSLIRIRVATPDAIHPRFLHAWLSSPTGKDALKAGSQSATSQMNLTTAAISHIRVPVPPLEEQRKIMEFLEAAVTSHDSAVAAAEIRLAIAREIAFKPITSMDTRTSNPPPPRLLIQTAHPEFNILATEDGNGTPMPNSSLWPEVRALVESLPDRPLARLFDPYASENVHLDRSELARLIAVELRALVAICASHPHDLIRTYVKDAMINVEYTLASRLGIYAGERSVGSFLLELDTLPPETQEQVHVHLT